MKKKGLSLSKRVALAERKEKDAKRRMYDKDREMRRSNAITYLARKNEDGSMDMALEGHEDKA